MRKRLKMRWLLEGVFECARTLGRVGSGWKGIAAWVRRDSIVRSLNVGEMIKDCGAVVKFEVFIGSGCGVRSN